LIVGLAPRTHLFPYTTLFRSPRAGASDGRRLERGRPLGRGLPAPPADAGGSRLLRGLSGGWRWGGVALAGEDVQHPFPGAFAGQDRKSTRLNSSHVKISYAVF